MSYCRFSSQNWRSDVHVWADRYGGYLISVAARRRILPTIPDIDVLRLPTFGGKWDKDYRRMRYATRWREWAANVVYGFAMWWHHRIHLGSLAMIPLRPIGGPHDGKDFITDTPDECAVKLVELSAMGYRVPQYAIDALREDARELYSEV